MDNRQPGIHGIEDFFRCTQIVWIYETNWAEERVCENICSHFIFNINILFWLEFGWKFRLDSFSRAVEQNIGDSFYYFFFFYSVRALVLKLAREKQGQAIDDDAVSSIANLLYTVR